MSTAIIECTIEDEQPDVTLGQLLYSTRRNARISIISTEEQAYADWRAGRITSERYGEIRKDCDKQFGRLSLVVCESDHDCA